MQVTRPYKVAIKGTDGSIKYYRTIIKNSDGFIKSFQPNVFTDITVATAGTSQADTSRAG